MGQSTAHPWMHVLLPVLLAALCTLGDAPTRSLATLAQRLGVSEADAATVVPPLTEAPAPVVALPALPPASPPCAHDGTARHIVCPQDPATQQACESGKTKDHTVTNALLVHAPPTLLFLSAPHGGRVHEKRIAAATLSSFPTGSR